MNNIIFFHLVTKIRLKKSHVPFQILSIYYTQINIRKNFKIKNYEFELLGGSYSVSDIQNYIECIIKNHETLTTIPPIHVYINKINNPLVFKIKDGELLIIDITKLIDKSKNGKYVPSLEVFEAVLVQFNLVDNQYQQKSEVLKKFKRNTSYAYFLNVEPSKLVCL